MRRAFRHRASRATAVVLLSVAAAGCSDQKAREFAEQTALILQQRSDQISKKITAETKAYLASAAHAAEAQRALVETALANERTARVIALAADYDEGRKPVSRWQSELAEYGRVDYEANRELLAAGVDAGSRFLQNVHVLALEQERIDALARLLEALAEKPALAKDIEDLAGFAQEVKTEFDQKVCAQLEKQMAAGDAGAKSAFAAKKCAAG